MGPRVLPTLYKILPYPGPPLSQGLSIVEYTYIIQDSAIGPPLSQGLSIVEYGAPSVTYIIQDSTMSSSQSGSIYSRVWGPECYLHYTRFYHTQVLLSVIPRSSSQSGSIYSRVWGPECYLHYTRFCHTQVLLSVRVYLYKVEYGAPSVTYIIQDSAIPRSSSQSGSIYSRVWGPECYLHYTRFCHTQVLLSVRVYLW